MFLIEAIKHNIEKNLKLVFLRDCESQAYKIKPVLFLLLLCFMVATKTLFKRNEKITLQSPL